MGESMDAPISGKDSRGFVGRTRRSLLRFSFKPSDLKLKFLIDSPCFLAHLEDCLLCLQKSDPFLIQLLICRLTMYIGFIKLSFTRLKKIYNLVIHNSVNC